MSGDIRTLVTTRMPRQGDVQTGTVWHPQPMVGGSRDAPEPAASGHRCNNGGVSIRCLQPAVPDSAEYATPHRPANLLVGHAPAVKRCDTRDPTLLSELSHIHCGMLSAQLVVQRAGSRSVGLARLVRTRTEGSRGAARSHVAL